MRGLLLEGHLHLRSRNRLRKLKLHILIKLTTFVVAAPAVMAQPETGTYSFESNNSSETGTVVITEISDNVYGVTYTPTGGDGSSQIMTKDVSGNLVASSGKFTIIEGQNSATPPAYKYGTTGEFLETGSINKVMDP